MKCGNWQPRRGPTYRNIYIYIVYLNAVTLIDKSHIVEGSIKRQKRAVPTGRMSNVTETMQLPIKMTMRQKNSIANLFFMSRFSQKG